MIEEAICLIQENQVNLNDSNVLEGNEFAKLEHTTVGQFPVSSSAACGSIAEGLSSSTARLTVKDRFDEVGMTARFINLSTGEVESQQYCTDNTFHTRIDAETPCVDMMAKR